MVERYRLWALAALTLLSLNACVAHYTRDQRTSDGYRYAPPVTDSTWEYTIPGPVELEPARRALRHHDVIPLSFASTGANGHARNRVEGLYLRSRLPGAKRLVVVLPIWGGEPISAAEHCLWIRRTLQGRCACGLALRRATAVSLANAVVHIQRG